MPRVIGASKNLIVFDDHLSGDKLGMYYRQPTTEEREGFLAMAVQREEDEVTSKSPEARKIYGLKILVGIRDGDFIRIQDDKEVPMSSDPESAAYYPDWKAEIEKGCMDLVTTMALHVFDRLPMIASPPKKKAAVLKTARQTGGLQGE